MTMGQILLKDLKTIATQRSVYFLTSLLLLLFIVNGVLYSFRYEEQIAYHNRMLSRHNFSTPIARTIFMPPNPLQFCSDNNPEQLTLSFHSQLNLFSISREDDEAINKFVSPVTWLDWSNLVKVVFSLLIIVMAHNLISDELETKTLGLICSYSVSRWQIYLGKLLSVIIVSTLILILAISTGLLSIILLGRITVDTAMIYKLLLFFVLSLTYCTFFSTASIAVSTITKRSTVSLSVMILIWIVSIIILPESITFAVKKQFQERYGFDYAAQFMHTAHDYTEEIGLVHDFADKIASVPEHEREMMIQEIKKRLLAVNTKYNEQDYRVTVSTFSEDLSFMKTLYSWLLLSPSTLYQVLVEKALLSGNEYYVEFVEAFLQFNAAFRDDLYNRYNTYQPLPVSTYVELDGKEVEISTDVPDFEDNGMQFDFSRAAAITPGTLKQFSVLILFVLLALIYGFIGFVRLDVR